MLGLGIYLLNILGSRSFFVDGHFESATIRFLLRRRLRLFGLFFLSLHVHILELLQAELLAEPWFQVD